MFTVDKPLRLPDVSKIYGSVELQRQKACQQVLKQTIQTAGTHPTENNKVPQRDWKNDSVVSFPFASEFMTMCQNTCVHVYGEFSATGCSSGRNYRRTRVGLN